MCWMGSKRELHPSSSLAVTGQFLKKCRKLFLVTVSWSMILQKVQYGETVSSIAFSLLFTMRPLFLSRNRN